MGDDLPVGATMNRTAMLALLVGLFASSCCLEEGRLDYLIVEAPLTTDEEVVTVEFCFRDFCDAAELATGEGTNLFPGGDGPFTIVDRFVERVAVRVEFNISGSAPLSPADGDIVRLRVLSTDETVLLDETRMVDYQFVGDWLCGGSQHGYVEL